MSLTAAEYLRIAPLQPPFRAALPALIADVEYATGKDVMIISGWRSRATQQHLWDHRAESRYPVARPGESLHEVGAGADLYIVNGTDEDYETLATIARSKYGLYSGYPSDPGHVTLPLMYAAAAAQWARITTIRYAIGAGLGFVALLALTPGADA